MNRTSFLTLASLVAFAVAVLALAFPAVLLAGKGVEPAPSVVVWVREVGVLIFAAGMTTFLARRSNDSPALRAVLIGNAVLHLGLLPIELLAFAQGVITRGSGVAPNSLIHVALAIGFIAFARGVRI